ncbi:MAG TPA: tRNA (adenosine(37)-N6)-threonylcarbamoyltransferase complex dimerization subunit type 1 TsaB [Candidatus Saccharimonadales bacterium]|jgi:tRNA threonylcarbamoyladenosine biosynthesis protein TsaB|nr:tRNA (adenosine(37)-N6)-threonylcarbamoyltransferase complex dimerization subunit type 1 TsaB [Candidatus Saccharimonadales bacterium]
MIILTIRTDKPEAEIGLYSDTQQLAYEVWHAHRDLSATIHTKIEQLLEKHEKSWHDLQGIVCFQGPGSFTGLRIGLTVGNALAYSLQIPIVAAQHDWIEQGIARLLKGESDPLALPHYGSEAHITMPRH